MVDEHGNLLSLQIEQFERNGTGPFDGEGERGGTRERIGIGFSNPIRVGSSLSFSTPVTMDSKVKLFDSAS